MMTITRDTASAGWTVIANTINDGQCRRQDSKVQLFLFSLSMPIPVPHRHRKLVNPAMQLHVQCANACRADIRDRGQRL